MGYSCLHQRPTPEAILALKQGVGRLIRTETDRGAMAILDSRINTKLVSCEFTLEQQGRPPRTLVTKHRTAFEILTDAQDHGVPIAL